MKQILEKRLVKVWSRLRAAVFLTGVVLLSGLSIAAKAGPWIDPGDPAVRHDIELLVDYGVIGIPITTWPLSWSDMYRALDSSRLKSGLPEPVVAAYSRLIALGRQNVKWGEKQTGYAIALSENSRTLRTFEDTPRTPLTATAQMSYTGTRYAARLRASLVTNPEDGKNFRLDGSYIGLVLGNTAVSLSWQDRWWGPGWGGSLVLSNNARPVPGLSIRRNSTQASKNAFLRWAGPWTWNVLASQLESDRGVPEARLLGARLAFKPHPSFEFGVSRTAQWGGDGRPDDLDSLFDLVLGRDNVGESGITVDSEPGNQLAGFDWRFSTRRLAVPTVFYGQLIGEDEAGGFPSRYLGLLGLSGTFDVARWSGSLRVSLEYSDTTCQFYESSKLFDCAYNSSIYSSGYRYRGRAIGHSTDGDSRQTALLLQYADRSQASLSAVVRRVNLNRGGAPESPHSLASQPTATNNLEVLHSRPLFDGKLTAGIGFDRIDQGESRVSDARVFVGWQTGI